MAGTRGSATSPRSKRRRRLTVAAAAGALFALVSSSIAFGEGLVGIGLTEANGTLVAIAPAGNASSSQGVALSGTGSSYGPVAVSANTSMDDATGLVGTTAGALVNTGIALVETPAQTYLAATSPPDPAGVAAKLQSLAEMTPAVLTNMATGLTQAPLTSASSAESGPPQRHLLNFPAIRQTYSNTCVPTSALMILQHRGMGNPGESGLAGEMKISKSGVTMKAAAPVLDRYYTGTDTIYVDRPQDPGELISMVTTDTWRWNHGLIVPGNPAAMNSYWPKDRPAQHALSVFGYDHRGGGRLVFMDPWDAWAAGTWNSNTAPNSLGSHEVPLSGVWAHLQGYGSSEGLAVTW